MSSTIVPLNKAIETGERPRRASQQKTASEHTALTKLRAEWLQNKEVREESQASAQIS